MIVVADTSPINYLVLIQEIDILPKMYGRVLVPRVVREELRQQAAPETVRAWIANAPTWLEVRVPTNPADDALAKRRRRELDAITLTIEFSAEQLIVDDREGRKRAEVRNIPVIGTLGVLKEAATLGLLNLRMAVQRLQTTNFYVAPEVLKSLFED